MRAIEARFGLFGRHRPGTFAKHSFPNFFGRFALEEKLRTRRFGSKAPSRTLNYGKMQRVQATRPDKSAFPSNRQR